MRARASWISGLLVLSALLVLTARRPPAPAAPPRILSGSVSAEREAAARRAFAWLEGQARDPEVLARYGGDYLEVFTEAARTGATEELRAAGASAGARAAPVCVAALLARPAPLSLEDATEAFTVLALAPEFGADDGALRALRGRLHIAFARFPRERLLGLAPGEACPELTRLCDALIRTHFAARAGFEVEAEMRWVLRLCAAVTYRPAASCDAETRLAQNNLVTHVIYVLSDYGRHRLDAARLADELAYMRAAAPIAMREGDLEAASEFVDSQRILGVPEGDPQLTEVAAWLLPRQRADGAFPLPGASEYDLYHATWTAFNALRAFSFEGEGPIYEGWPSGSRAATRPQKM